MEIPICSCGKQDTLGRCAHIDPARYRNGVSTLVAPQAKAKVVSFRVQFANGFVSSSDDPVRAGFLFECLIDGMK